MNDWKLCKKDCLSKFAINLPVDTFYVVNRTVKYNCQQKLNDTATSFWFSYSRNNIAMPFNAFAKQQNIKESCPQQQSVSSST